MSIGPFLETWASYDNPLRGRDYASDGSVLTNPLFFLGLALIVTGLIVLTGIVRSSPFQQTNLINKEPIEKKSGGVPRESPPLDWEFIKRVIDEQISKKL